MNGLTSFLFLCFFIPAAINSQFIDLQTMTQDFVLETKKIDIPGYPHSFNPTLTRWDGCLLMTFRIQKDGDTSKNGFVILNDDLEIISDPKPLEILFKNPPEYEKMQDPRIIEVANKHFILFNNQIGVAPTTKEIRRMFLASLKYDGERLYTNNPEALLHFDKTQEQYQEKNWVPFAYKDRLYLAYSLNPHTIFRPEPETESCATIASTKSSLAWNWGPPRGGTPALLVDGQYLAFFHSSQLMMTTQSKGKKIAHYFMGAYTFSKNPPFAITAMSPEPIVGPNFYEGEQYQTWKPLVVVFPCGFVYDENFIWISYGRQDHEVWIAKLDKKKLLDSLIPVNQVKEDAQ